MKTHILGILGIKRWLNVNLVMRSEQIRSSDRLLCVPASIILFQTWKVPLSSLIQHSSTIQQGSWPLKFWKGTQIKISNWCIISTLIIIEVFLINLWNQSLMIKLQWNVASNVAIPHCWITVPSTSWGNIVTLFCSFYKAAFSIDKQTRTSGKPSFLKCF